MQGPDGAHRLGPRAGGGGRHRPGEAERRGLQHRPGVRPDGGLPGGDSGLYADDAVRLLPPVGQLRGQRHPLRRRRRGGGRRRGGHERHPLRAVERPVRLRHRQQCAGGSHRGGGQAGPAPGDLRRVRNGRYRRERGRAVPHLAGGYGRVCLPQPAQGRRGGGRRRVQG